MPIEVVDRYKIECLSCGYIWETRYPKVPAGCPSCHAKIHNTGNYNLITRYIHYEKTDREKRQFGVMAIVAMILFFVFFWLWFKIGFLISLFLCIIVYSILFKVVEEKIK